MAKIRNIEITDEKNLFFFYTFGSFRMEVGIYI